MNFFKRYSFILFICKYILIKSKREWYHFKNAYLIFLFQVFGVLHKQNCANMPDPEEKSQRSVRFVCDFDSNTPCGGELFGENIGAGNAFGIQQDAVMIYETITDVTSISNYLLISTKA